jgi:chromosome segregation ATPase
VLLRDLGVHRVPDGQVLHALGLRVRGITNVLWVKGDYMAKKTKAQLEQELKIAQKEVVDWKAACDRVNAKLGEECRERFALEQKLNRLKGTTKKTTTKKTKAQLEQDVKDYKKLYQEAEKDHEVLINKYQDLWDKADKYKAELANLHEAHDATQEKLEKFVDNYRRISEEQTRKHEILQDNLGTVVRELGEAKEKIEQQATKLMVTETAMRSMTLHIILLEKQKGQKNA